MATSKAPVFLLALLGVALAVAGPIVAGGSMEAAGLVGKGRRSPYAAARQLATAATSMLGLEAHRRRVLSDVISSSLNANSAACLGSCPAKGGPYTGRGCANVYQCRGS